MSTSESDSLMISLCRGGEVIGTWRKLEIKEMFRAGMLRPDDLYWHDGMAEWKRLFPSPPPLPPDEDARETYSETQFVNSPPLLGKIKDLAGVKELWGICPGCSVNTWFHEPSLTEVFGEAWTFIKERGLKSTARELVNAWGESKSGSKLAHTFVCDKCNIRVQVCGHCIRPNREKHDRIRCDYCHGALIA